MNISQYDYDWRHMTTQHLHINHTAMAQPRRKEAIAKAFNNSPELQQFVLTNVTSDGEILGSGSFGSVEKVCPCIES